MLEEPLEKKKLMVGKNTESAYKVRTIMHFHSLQCILTTRAFQIPKNQLSLDFPLIVGFFQIVVIFFFSNFSCNLWGVWHHDDCFSKYCSCQCYTQLECNSSSENYHCSSWQHYQTMWDIKFLTTLYFFILRWKLA